MKYWNPKRIKRRQRTERRGQERDYERHLDRERRDRTYAEGDPRKNTRLMLEALGSARHRRMLEHLRKGGAMSVSHLVRPFGIPLSNAMAHVHALEQSGFITTHKRGRIRFCVYNPDAARELSAWLGGNRPFDVD